MLLANRSGLKMDAPALVGGRVPGRLSQRGGQQGQKANDKISMEAHDVAIGD
jgi:hypothetical protein